MDKLMTVALVGVFHLVCCGLSLLLLSGGSLAFLVPSWSAAMAIAVALGIVGLGWYLRRRSCATCLSYLPEALHEAV